MKEEATNAPILPEGNSQPAPARVTWTGRAREPEVWQRHLLARLWQISQTNKPGFSVVEKQAAWVAFHRMMHLYAREPWCHQCQPFLDVVFPRETILEVGRVTDTNRES